ncbi:MAG: hypothetical protein NW224_24130 [Leptolyngbyaceae cyanobacterium bins.302]|nr:hypothetical protein [Leptolyngbyaceae cyanobacterium bins.302]
MKHLWAVTSLGAVMVGLATNSQIAFAQTTLPNQTLNPFVTFQTSGRERLPSVGDWYTTANSASTDRVHRFLISITPSDLAAAGGSITVTILDGEVNGEFDEFNSNNFAASRVLTCTPADNCDPSRFTLINSSGAVLNQLDYNLGVTPDPPNQAEILGTITAPGVYQVVSEAGAFPITGNATPALNDDDNGFRIQVSGVTNLLIGQFQGTLQQNTPGDVPNDLRLYALVGPGTGSLFFRNFDIDSQFFGGQSIQYISPPGGLGTISEAQLSTQGLWNNGGTLNTGGQVISGLNPIVDAGYWEVRINAFASDNQTLFEANTGPDTSPNTGPNRLPLFDAPPQRAGNFLITTDTTLETPVGQPVCHPFRVTNNFFTTDIINLTATGTNQNYTTQFFRDAAGTTPLTDTDGDGQVDTGILAANGGFVDLFFCVTPGQGALLSDGSVVVDTTTITGTSFMDREVRAQAGTGAPAPQSIVKTTSPPRGGGGATGTANFRLVKRITNVIRNGSVLPGVNFGAFVDDPGTTDDNAAGWSQTTLAGILALPLTNPVQSGDEVTYTVYFLADGSAPVLDASICDPIPGGMTFVLNSLELGLANNPVTSVGDFFTPLAPLPENNSCPIQTNPNGATVTNLGTVANTSGSNFGFIRFRVRVN